MTRKWPAKPEQRVQAAAESPTAVASGDAEGLQGLLMTLTLRQEASAWPCWRATTSCLAAPQGACAARAVTAVCPPLATRTADKARSAGDG